MVRDNSSSSARLALHQIYIMEISSKERGKEKASSFAPLALSFPLNMMEIGLMISAMEGVLSLYNKRLLREIQLLAPLREYGSQTLLITNKPLK